MIEPKSIPIGGEWSGAIADAPSCHCLCAAVHPERGICDLEAPRAILSLHDGTPDEAVHQILMCKPCAEAALAVHPRARDAVVLEVRSHGI